MDKLLITGGVPLRGAITISGAKNAALPLMAAGLLSAERVTLHNLPKLADIETMAKLLLQHGMEIEWNEGNGTSCDRSITLKADDITSLTAPYHLVCTMRASVLVLGPLLARFGEAKVSLPGGCAIGTRPIDMHLHAFEAMGATIELVDGYVHASVKGRLKGTTIAFDKVSVGATENALMAATLADGKTIIKNAAREPEIGDLAELLNKMGAKISGIGSDTLTIEGVPTLHGAEHAVIADRIEAGTYAVAAAITGGELELIGVRRELLESVIDKLAEADIDISDTPRGLKVKRKNGILANIDITTQPFPGFPTDMQAQMMALLAVANGASTVTETIFENRYMHVPELQRMGADIQVHGSTATIRGVQQLKGAEVMATDLRASSSLVLAALVAEGTTTINRIYHLDRGYECLEDKLSACGARIERVGKKPVLKKKAG